MNLRTCILILACLVFKLSSAQQIEVKYNRNKISNAVNNNAVSQEYTLIYSNGISLFQEDNSKTLAKIKKEMGNQEDLLSLDLSKKLFYYKNFNNNELISLLGEYQVKDSLINWNWKITEEVKDVAGYKCRKAVSSYQGYSFVAWYTEDIPINAGPEIYDGLPGLILQAYNLGYEYVASNILISDKVINIAYPKISDKTYTFLAAQEELMKKLQAPGQTVEYKNDGDTSIKITTKTFAD
ncbi:MAG: GLPGLI family protein [Flavobacteriaceae bacterium]|jgi:GLPGLI family protein|nr:GLPGLI family protein [Flavobacteriaceae bacterium]